MVIQGLIAKIFDLTCDVLVLEKRLEAQSAIIRRLLQELPPRD